VGARTAPRARPFAHRMQEVAGRCGRCVDVLRNGQAYQSRQINVTVGWMEEAS